MFIILLNYKKDLATVDKYLIEHRAYLDNGYKKGYFVASGPRNPRTGGIIISQLKDRQQLAEIIKADPFSINEIADFEIIEFNPIKFHENFASFI